MASIGKEMANFVNGLTDGKDIAIGSRMTSIASGASSAIYYFPIIASKNISGKIMALVANNLESSYASFVRACFALTPAMNVKSSELLNINDYLELFHQNIGLQNKKDLYVGLHEGLEEYKMFPNNTLNEASISKVSAIMDRMDSKAQDIKSNGNSKPRPRHIFSGSDAKIVDSQNNIRPTVLEITAKFVMDQNIIDVKIPVGVKSVLHMVNPDQLTDHVMDSVAGKGLLHNLIRYTTGELSSLSDIVFNTSRIKKYVRGDNDVARWAGALDHRKQMSKIRNAIPFLSKKPYLPNTTIMLSIDDVADIERETGYDLLKDINRATKFMKDNFLLSLVIVDELTETLYILYDGHNEYEDYPFVSIQRENEKHNSQVETLIKSLVSSGTMGR